MLEMILDKQIIVLLLGVFTAVGVLSKCVVSQTMKRLVRAAANMGKSEHPLMRLVRAKFEHACMVNESVENVGVFVDKYLYSYRVFGVRLHSIRRLENAAALCCVVVGLAGSALAYRVYGMNDLVLRTGAVGAGLGVLVFVFHLTTDESYRMQMTRNYMVDYLENVCLRKYMKAYQKDAAQPQRPRPGREVPSPLGAPEVSGPGTAPEIPGPGAVPETAPGRQQESVDIPDMPSQIEAVEMLEEDYEEIAAAMKQEGRDEPEGVPKKETAAAEEKQAGRRTIQEAPDPAAEKEIRIRRILEEFMA